MADKQVLGTRAYLFAVLNSKQAYDVVATIPAVSPGARRRSGSGAVGSAGQRISQDAVLGWRWQAASR
jgi:hypothetical protein